MSDAPKPISWKSFLPIIVAVVLALIPAPPGLPQHAWYFFSLFCGVVVSLVLEPIPVTATGIIAITVSAVLAPWVLFSPEQMAKPGFKLAGEAVKWAFAGFANPTCWLVGGAFMFALAYQKTGLGRRIALMLVRKLGSSTLALGYAAAFADTILAPFIPSNTARGAGTMFPVIIGVPPIYDSKPHDDSSQKIGAYILWTTFAADCVTSSLFLTGCAPNFLAVSFIKKIAHIDINFATWFFASASFAIPLLLAVPLIGYVVCPPKVKRSPEVPAWAARQLDEMGPLSRREITLAILVTIAVVLWIFADEYVDAAIVAFMVISAMLILGVLTWDDMARHHSAWTTLVLLATLVSMAGGLSSTGFVAWLAKYVAGHVAGLGPTTIVCLLVSGYFFAHYFFSSLTAHTTTMMPIMLAVGMGMPGFPIEKLAYGLALTTGIMGVISPYATGAALPYYNSGFFTSAQFWRNGTVYGLIFLAALLLLGIPLL